MRPNKASRPLATNPNKDFRENDLAKRHQFESLVTKHFDVLCALAEAYNFPGPGRIDTPRGTFNFVPKEMMDAFHQSFEK